MNKKIFKIFTYIFIIFVLIVGYLYVDNRIGINANSIEEDIRISQKIDDEWIVEGNVSDELAAFISYPKDKSDQTFSIYVKRPGLSYGYFFRSGGSNYRILETIVQFTVENCSESAYISINSQKVERVEIDDGNSIRIIDVDPSQPFAIILPNNEGNITFYNVDGEIVEYSE